MQPRNLIAALLLALAAAPALAASCSPTPPLPVQHYPGVDNITPGNNLRMPAGKAEESTDGQRVVLYGTLLDNNCVPIADARVELWQVDPFGKYMLATPEDQVSARPVFAGTGRTYTGNDGSFRFITSFPGVADKRAPHFDLRISLPGQKDFTTALYFAEDGRNAKDPVLAKLKQPEDRRKLNMQVNEAGAAGLGAAITLVMPYKVNYRGY